MIHPDRTQLVSNNNKLILSLIDFKQKRFSLFAFFCFLLDYDLTVVHSRYFSKYLVVRSLNLNTVKPKILNTLRA